MDELANLSGAVAAWVAPGAPSPEDSGRVGNFRRVLADPASLAACLDNGGLRIPGYYEATHPIHVASLSLATAAAMGLGQAARETLAVAALIHDLGQLLVPPPIRYKIGALTPEEIAIMRRHPELGARLAETLCGTDIAEIVRDHHERWDGTGYPRGLSGTAIPVASRILAVADTFDAMSSDRVYARRYSPVLAYQAVRASAGRAFDPAVCAAFLSAIAPFPENAAVRLAGGETGVVVSTVPERPFRPVVRLDDGSIVEGRDVAALQIVRSSPRYTAGVPVVLEWAGESHEGRTINVSAGGAAMIEYGGRVRHGGDAEVAFIGRGTARIVLPARIVWSRPSGGRGRLLGLWFGPLASNLQEALLELAGAGPGAAAEAIPDPDSGSRAGSHLPGLPQTSGGPP